ncbi:MAG: DUF2779 domain-containing protein [Pseudomonadales bacterium]|nr:DUF2779 domain-containing protein [Pseudomonadales bacterium]
MTLSKSDYMLFLRHPAWLWLKKYDKSKLPPIDEDTQAMFDVGHEFESYAEQLFPGAVRLGFSNYDSYLALADKTLNEINNGTQVILQGRLEASGLTCIFDVLQKVGEKEFDLIEIKSTTKAKPEHEYDLAFQLLVLEKSDYKVRNIVVIHANKDYVRDGAIDVQQFCTQTDITDKVRSLSDVTEQQILAAQAVLNSSTMPDISPRYVNKVGIPGVSQWFQEWMGIFKLLKPNTDPYNVYELSYPSSEQIGKLEDTGITRIADVPDELVLRPKQFAQIKTTREDKPLVDKEKIKEFLDTFQYPLYFFDYETMSSIIPTFDGMSPYKDYPFQYSLHILRSPTSEVEHYEYLHADNSNPMPGLLSQLKQDIGDEGTVLAWNMSYEKGCNDRMAALYPEYSEFLMELNERINDLMIPFSEMWYFHKDFFGSASVKKVLPVMAPELSYKELDVNNGLLARRMWTQTVLEDKHQDRRAEIMENLSKYCTLDTYAMVRIYEELQKLVK